MKQLKARMPRFESVADCFDWTCGQIDRDDAAYLVLHYLNCSHRDLYLSKNKDRRLNGKLPNPVNSVQADKLKQAVSRRQNGEPLAYITESKYFWNMLFRVTPDVLIPRNETELLVQVALEVAKPGQRILDLGTGSGVIALTLKGNLECDVVATDVDQKALAVCRQNMQKLDLDITLLHSDWFEKCEGTFDIIVSNPPYVAANDPYLSQGDLRFEPQEALTDGADGLLHLRTVIADAPNYLNNNGWLIVEHGFDQPIKVQELFDAAGFHDISTKTDYGGHLRIVQGLFCGR
ncbi:MAG: peptide chain release factor N(5)-glutamine methyltransferase [Gammaproteobacteria bacterium]|nr:peptide chain release factor N(5)-glutamine methyltransferase [Gammaproteobacteria bacterium]MXX94827.1 peptide chain release factor N(5)-glutamine methyltransferase [Gammaproteobacteria bacterium]MYF52673.1 peptide chain release factor N(5)-glutamine methyltransferase [Gammaproteobacteria bacterium]MYK43632.1 peptide chain release factor N(5)-glutamine methyltransferase [Gammaproteobacteria bacterium]